VTGKLFEPSAEATWRILVGSGLVNGPAAGLWWIRGAGHKKNEETRGTATYQGLCLQRQK
jgi:hypothetical protein